MCVFFALFLQQKKKIVKKILQLIKNTTKII